MAFLTSVLSSPILFACSIAFILLAVCAVGYVITGKNVVITACTRVEEQISQQKICYFAKFDCGKTLHAAEHHILELQNHPYGVLIYEHGNVRFFYSAHSAKDAAKICTREKKRIRGSRLLSLCCAAMLPAVGGGLLLVLLYTHTEPPLQMCNICLFMFLPTACCLAHDRILETAKIFREHIEIALSHAILFTALLFFQNLSARSIPNTAGHSLIQASLFLSLCLPTLLCIQKAYRKV